jgi:hypothetical protein
MFELFSQIFCLLINFFLSDGILAAYYHSLYNVQLYGPTNFAPVIRHVARFAQVRGICAENIISSCHLPLSQICRSTRHLRRKYN